MSKKGGAALQKDVPWRASSAAKPIPKIHYSPILRIPQTPYSNYALSVMKDDDPIGSGLGKEAVVEPAGPDCIVPGQTTPIKLLGLKVWPIEVDLKFMEPVGRELKSIGREGDLRKGPWLEEEDDQLAVAVTVLGDRKWDALAKASGLRRSGKSCRLRWMNYLRPNLKHGNISADEEQIIIELHEKWGNRWSKIARRLPGRTDNEIKNYWRSYMKKKECLISTTNTSTSPRPECETSSPCSINDEWFLMKDDISPQPLDDASDALDILSLTHSPYETRLTEWMPDGHPCVIDPKDGIWDYDLYEPEWISGDCTTSLWDISLWDG